MSAMRWTTWVMTVVLAVSAACDGAEPAAPKPGPGVRLEVVAKGLEFPVDAMHDGVNADRLYVIEQPGRLRIVRDGKLLPDSYLDIADHVTHQGECGLLGVAFHPDFARNGYFYVNYTTGRRRDLRTVIAEFKVDPAAMTVDAKTERVVMEIAQPYNNHNGGHIEFGHDGMLYIGMGDGGAANDPQNRAQNPQELLGKMLRIDVNARDPYAVPKDNPFVNDPRFRPEIWALGLRNPWRFAFDRKTGACYTGDVGQNKWEEVDVLVAGGNYGWRIRESMHDFRPDEKPVTGTLIEPIAEYGRELGASITGGLVYRGKQYPKLDGVYLYADYVSGRFWGLKYDEQAKKAMAIEELPTTINGAPSINRIQPAGLGDDLAGEVYVCDHTRGNLYKLVLAE